LKDFGDKVDAGEKQNIEDAIAKAKKAMETNDPDTLKSAQEELTRTSHKLAEAMYAKASQGAKAGGPGPGTGFQGAGPQEAGAQEGAKRPGQEDVVDADFEDVKGKS
jgi:molecular chaperone DnaK